MIEEYRENLFYSNFSNIYHFDNDKICLLMFVNSQTENYCLIDEEHY